MSNAKWIRTDLAVEAGRKVNEPPASLNGVSFSQQSQDGIEYSSICVSNEAGSNAIGKPMGSYLTLNIGQIWLDEREQIDAKQQLFTRLLGELIDKTDSCPTSIFVACLGNIAVTADAVGPMVQNELEISRHLTDSRIRRLFGPCDLSALSPGVTGQTGIETLTLIKAAVNEVHPSLVIAVDALAARSPDRLCTTIQLSSTGITPGSGIGNHRHALNEKTLGVPVIAIGVPTLVDSSTLLADALSHLGIEDDDPKISPLLDPDRHFFVTRKETDLAVSLLSKLIASGINAIAQGRHK